MASKEIEYTGRSIKMFGPLKPVMMQLLRAEVREGFSQITEIDVEFISAEIKLPLEDVLGRVISLEILTEKKNKRYFSGHCIEVLYEGTYQGQGHFVASLRSWNWFLTQTSNCRIFQDKTAMEIIKMIFGDHGFSDFKDKTTRKLAKRVYCVQYRESDWAFVQRLIAEEGMYYYFEYTKDKDTLVLCDDTSQHAPIDERSDIKFFFKEDNMRRREDHVFDWRERETLRSAVASLADYDFEKSGTKLFESKTIKKGTHKHNKYEVYDYPGRYKEVGDGQNFARLRVERYAAEHERMRGIANVRTMACGHRFKLTKHPRDAAKDEYLVIEAIHQLQIETEYDKGELGESALGERITLDLDKNPDPYRVQFRCQPKEAPFRTPYDDCKKPVIPGLQTAVVTGPSKKEIYTDKYGRVKVQFHWDRDGKKDEKTSCWIRKAEPWSGKSWGMVWVPRIGQEVVVQFEEGDPDRPLIVGMVFNDATKHPYTLPTDMTMMGWKTRSSEKGSAKTFHELVFEDKIEKEYIRFQSERNYFQIVKNNADIKIGLEHKDKGDMTIEIQNDLKETLKEGNHTFTVAKGEEKYSVKKNRTVKVEGAHKEDITKNQTVKIKGAQSTTVTKAIKTKSSTNSVSITAAQKITLKANTKITLQCGLSKIELTPGGIKMQTTMLQMKGKGMAKLEGGFLQMKGNAMAILKGSVTMIN